MKAVVNDVNFRKQIVLYLATSKCLSKIYFYSHQPYGVEEPSRLRAGDIRLIIHYARLISSPRHKVTPYPHASISHELNAKFPTDDVCGMWKTAPIYVLTQSRNSIAVLLIKDSPVSPELSFFFRQRFFRFSSKDFIRATYYFLY